MAEENIVASPKASPAVVEAADSHKRKLEDLELNVAPEPPTDSEAVAQEDGGADEPEPKRPRLEINSDSANEEADNLVEKAGNGDSVIEEADGQENEEMKESAEPESADDSGLPLAEQESVKNAVDKTTQEPAPNDNEKAAVGSADELGQQIAIANTDELGQPNAGIDLPEVDVPVQSDGIQSGSDSQMLSLEMDVPNDKIAVLIYNAGWSLQDNSGSKIQIMRDAYADPKPATWLLKVVGTLESISKAEKLMKDVIAEADAIGSPSLVAREFSAVQGGEQDEIQVPIEKKEIREQIRSSMAITPTDHSISQDVRQHSLNNKKTTRDDDNDEGPCSDYTTSSYTLPIVDAEDTMKPLGYPQYSTVYERGPDGEFVAFHPPEWEFDPQGYHDDHYTVVGKGSSCPVCSRQHPPCFVCSKVHHSIDCPYLNLLPKGESFDSSLYAVHCLACDSIFNEDKWICSSCSMNEAVLRKKFCNICIAWTHYWNDCPYLNELPKGASFNNAISAVRCYECDGNSFDVDKWICEKCSGNRARLRFGKCSVAAGEKQL